MYESPLTLNEWKIEANSLDQAIKDTAESVGEKFDRYVLHVISEMGITVDRDELIKALRYDRDQYTKGYHDGMERGIEISSPTWIPVTERLPDSDDEYVLCCGSKGGMFVGWAAIKTYDGSGKCTGFQNSGKGRNFTHWMPLPEPPKEDIDNG